MFVKALEQFPIVLPSHKLVRTRWHGVTRSCFLATLETKTLGSENSVKQDA